MQRPAQSPSPSPRPLLLLLLLLLGSAAAQGPANGSRVAFGPGPGPEPRARSLLLDWAEHADPYEAAADAACSAGDLTECFKARALESLDDLLTGDAFQLTEHARVVRMPRAQLRSLGPEPFEYSSAPRADEPEWDRLSKFLLRRAERFLKSAALELRFPAEVTERGRFAPRFVDEITSELDLLENKSESPFSRTRLKRLFVPLLVILKLFKLKLLLFLPLLLGLASFKKLLGLLALLLPGLIAAFRLCKPDLQQGYGSFGHSSYYHKPPQPPQYAAYPAYGYASDGGYFGSYGRNPQPSAAASGSPVSGAVSGPVSGAGASAGGVAFREDPAPDPHRLAFRSHSPPGAS